MHLRTMEIKFFASTVLYLNRDNPDPKSIGHHALSSYHSFPRLLHSSWKRSFLPSSFFGPPGRQAEEEEMAEERESELLWPSNNKKRGRRRQKTRRWRKTGQSRQFETLSHSPLFLLSSPPWSRGGRPFQKVIQPFTLFHLPPSKGRKTSLGCHSSLRPNGS